MTKLICPPGAYKIARTIAAKRMIYKKMVRGERKDYYDYGAFADNLVIIVLGAVWDDIKAEHGWDK